MTYTSL